MTTLIRDDLADSLVYRWTADAEARAIKAETERKRDMTEWLNEWQSELDRKRKAKLTSRLVVAGLVGIFLVLAIGFGVRS